MRGRRGSGTARKGCPSCAFSRITNVTTRNNCRCHEQKYNMETHLLHLGHGISAGTQIWKLQMDFLWKLHREGRYHDFAWEPGYAAFDLVMGAEMVQPYPVWFPWGNEVAVPDHRIPRGRAWFRGELGVDFGVPGVALRGVGGPLMGLGGQVGTFRRALQRQGSSRLDSRRESGSSRDTVRRSESNT